MFEPTFALQDLKGPQQDSSLYILAFGVSSFQRAKLMPLRYPGKDARDVAATLHKAGAGCFKQVVFDVLENERATREGILRAVETLSRRVQRQDTAVLFFAGHGLCDAATDLYYFAPYDLDDDHYLSSAVPGAMLWRQLLPLPGRRLIIVDTCNAGSLTDGHALSRGAVPAPAHASSTMLREFGREVAAARGSGEDASESLIVLASASASQPAVESARWDNGAFTKALLEGLSGKADNGAGAVTMRMLSSYVRGRVRELTNHSQEPVFTVLDGAQDFELLRSAPASASAESGADPLIGQSLGAYRVVAKVAQTSRTAIYRAVEEGDELNSVQLRVLDAQQSNQPELARRFWEAAQALLGVVHRSMVRIREPGGRLGSDGRAYVVLEDAVGPLLGEIIHSISDRAGLARRVMTDALAALRAAHQAGVLYLSLGPTRIVLRKEPLPVLLLDGDGACLRDAPEPPPLRQADQPILELNDPELYLAPEVSTGLGPIDQRADVFALGAIAYLIYAGVPPYVAATYGQLRTAKQTPARPLRELNPELAPALLALIDRMLAPQPDQRPSLTEVAEFLTPSTGPVRPPRVQPAARPSTPPPLPRPTEAAATVVARKPLPPRLSPEKSEPARQPAAAAASPPPLPKSVTPQAPRPKSTTSPAATPPPLPQSMTLPGAAFQPTAFAVSALPDAKTIVLPAAARPRRDPPEPSGTIGGTVYSSGTWPNPGPLPRPQWQETTPAGLLSTPGTPVPLLSSLPQAGPTLASRREVRIPLWATWVIIGLLLLCGMVPFLSYAITRWSHRIKYDRNQPQAGITQHSASHGVQYGTQRSFGRSTDLDRARLV